MHAVRLRFGVRRCSAAFTCHPLQRRVAHAAARNYEKSSPNIFYLDAIRRGVTQADLTGITDIGSHWAYRRQTPSRAPLFEILQRGGIQSDRVPACIECGMVNRVVRLRLRAASILRDEAIHQIENHFLCDDWITIDLREAFCAKTRALSKAPPVIDVGNRHVVNATGDSIRFTDTHHWNINDLVYFAGNDPGEMTYVAGVLGIR